MKNTLKCNMDCNDSRSLTVQKKNAPLIGKLQAEHTVAFKTFCAYSLHLKDGFFQAVVSGEVASIFILVFEVGKGIVV